jgi:hypothetical protein
VIALVSPLRAASAPSRADQTVEGQANTDGKVGA